MVSQGLISQRVFAFVFHRGGVKGTLLFGEGFEDCIPGTVQYLPLQSVAPDYWTVSFERLAYTNDVTLRTGLLTILDTGTFRTHLPEPVVQDLFSKIGVTLHPEGDVVDCDAIATMPTLVFHAEHFQVTWHAWQYVQQISPNCCLLTIQAAAPNLPADVLLGMSFLRHYSTVFDVDKKRVGFAKPAEMSPSSIDICM
ncbi:hypothetical protein CRM22_006072 [Opisthorchis felineus]|uniref:Peptidase A1 domain-containing protein n=1 Tax=Opisthorchis felineus TaxID=147828 RepID=A0A4S2LUY2_OPIFE|nr:hypothetical protein CRM22_006072 [Opisthorchis felineus]